MGNGTARRSCALLFDWLLVIDGTSNINKDRLSLLVAVGVLNSGKTFPICLSYCLSESAESFAFVWDSLKENASNLAEICLLFPIPASSSVAKLVNRFLQFRRCSLTRSFRAVIGTLLKRRKKDSRVMVIETGDQRGVRNGKGVNMELVDFAR
jgi:hypothetical protein